MRNVLICTVGTSLKNNLERSGNNQLLKMLEKENSQGIALALAEIDPTERLAGAEINSNAAIIKKRLISRRDHLYQRIFISVLSVLATKYKEAR